MKLTVNANTNEEREPIEAGVYTASIVGIYDLGTQSQVWEGKPKESHQIVFLFELDTQQIVSKTYTASLHEKASLRKDLQAFTGGTFEDGQTVDIFDFIGLSGQVNITKKKSGDKEYSKIESLMPLRKGQKGYEAKNELLTYSIEENKKNIPACPEWIKKKIEESPEFKALK